MVRATPTAVQVEGSTTWYHLNHCMKVPGKTKGGIELRSKDEKDNIVEGIDSNEHSGVDAHRSRGGGNLSDRAECPGDQSHHGDSPVPRRIRSS